MQKLWRALFCALLVLTLFQSTNCGKFGSRGFGGGRHSYPSSGGLSGSGSRHSGGLSGGHGYPSSRGGLSGSGGSHGYPSSGGNHGYPSSGGNHGYPSGGGLSGSGGSHGYPSSGGVSGNKPAYPSSGGMSGSGQSHTYPGSRGSGGSTHHTTINHNYNYSPPQQIRYAAPGQTAHSYPVYHGTPPTYVYQYKNSDSKYGTLLAGLALLNLGTLGASVYAASKAGSGGSSSGNGHYKPQPGEYCKFGIKKDNGDYEETKIDCNLITSFIFQEEANTPQQKAGGTNTVVTTTTNVTVVNMTNGVQDSPQTTTQPPNVLYQMLANGTLVPVNVTLPAAAVNTTTLENGAASNGTVTSSMTVTTTTTNTTVTNALDVKGEAIKVTPGMQCFVIRHSPVNHMRKTVPCGLLQSYADQSIKKNSAARNIPTFTVLCAIVAFAFY